MSNPQQSGSSGSFLLAATAGLTVVLLALVAALWWLPRIAPPLPHPEFSSLFIRPNALDHEAPRWWMGLIFGGLSIALLGCLAVLGARRANGSTTSGASRWVAVAFAAYLVPFVALMLSYRNEVGGTDMDGWILGMPPSTVWLLIGVWNAPWVIVLLLFVRFDTWTFTSEDQSRFDALVVRYKNRDAQL